MGKGSIHDCESRFSFRVENSRTNLWAETFWKKIQQILCVDGESEIKEYMQQAVGNDEGQVDASFGCGDTTTNMWRVSFEFAIATLSFWTKTPSALRRRL